MALLTALSALGLIPVDARAQQIGPGGINFPELFLSLDGNNDGMISRGEVPESAHSAFDRLLKLADKNGDGKIERDEYRDILLRARDSAASAGANRFAEVDKNGDGKISRDEFRGPPPMFDRIDTDKDGFLTRAELAGLRPGGGSPAMLVERVKSMDRNGDGKITREEFTGFPENFTRLDANKNGVIEPSELSGFATSRPSAASPKKP